MRPTKLDHGDISVLDIFVLLDGLAQSCRITSRKAEWNS